MDRIRHDGRWLREFTGNQLCGETYPTDKFVEAVEALRDDADAIKEALDELASMLKYEW